MKIKMGKFFQKKLLIYQSLLSEWHFSIIGLEQLGRDGLPGEIQFLHHSSGTTFVSKQNSFSTPSIEYICMSSKTP